MERRNSWEREYTIFTSLCDHQGKLSLPSIFDIFMDLAAEHAARLGVGYYDMLARGCCWVAVRTRIRLLERPVLGDRITAVTWPARPALAKSDRFYRLVRDGKVLAEGRTEWAVRDLETGAVRRTDSYGFPKDLDFREERVCGAPFTRFRNMELLPEKLVRAYTVDPMDIDVGHHMNNVAYIRMLAGTFSTAEQDQKELSETEISYRLSCFEGEELRIYRQEEEDGWFFQVQKENGEVAAHARMLV